MNFKDAFYGVMEPARLLNDAINVIDRNREPDLTEEISTMRDALEGVWGQIDVPFGFNYASPSEEDLDAVPLTMEQIKAAFVQADVDPAILSYVAEFIDNPDHQRLMPNRSEDHRTWAAGQARSLGTVLTSNVPPQPVLAM